jgi:flagellar motor protein MotB
MAQLKKLVIGAPRTREKDESEVRWLMSYSDFMMQLVCLFILLYSVSSLDKGRMARMASAYRASLGIGELAAHETKSSGDKMAIGGRSLLGGTLGGGDLPRGIQYRVDPVPGGLRVAFEEPLFDETSSVLTAKGEEALDAAARLLRAYAGAVVVTGAGDDAKGLDALPLAVGRAQSVVARLVRAGLDPRFITAAGRQGGEARRATIQIRTE